MHSHMVNLPMTMWKPLDKRWGDLPKNMHTLHFTATIHMLGGPDKGILYSKVRLPKFRNMDADLNSEKTSMMLHSNLL